MAEPNITEEVHFEMLEKKSDGSFKAKYPKVKSKSGVTFDEHLAEDAIHGKPVVEVILTSNAIQIDILLPDGVNDFILICKAISVGSSSNLFINFNDDNSNNYGTVAYISFPNSVVEASANNSLPYLRLNINNKTNFKKLVSGYGTMSTRALPSFVQGIWNNTTEKINKITLKLYDSTFKAGSEFYIYEVM